jgi:Helix-turn-helix domain
LQVLHVWIFDFLNYKTGHLDPSYAAIARAANVCVRTVANALKRLRELGLLHWEVIRAAHVPSPHP